MPQVRPDPSGDSREAGWIAKMHHRAAGARLEADRETVSMPATDVTIEHYQRQAVKEVILRYCQNEHGARALNSDEHWYKGTDDINHTVALRGPADYEDTIKRGRTLYATLDILEQAVFEQDSKWDEKAGRPETPLGTLAECLAFTLSTDIDGIGDIRSLAVKQAVEAAAQFHVDYLKARGIEKSVYCLYSGGGIYVHLHHGLFAVDMGNTELTPEARKEEYQILCKAYNQLIGEISQAFFRKYPQYIGLVKFDQLNNQKRTFKTIFSIHKRLPFAVIPLDPNNIKISFEKASLPLSDEVLAKGAQWYQSFDPTEKGAIMGLLKDKIEAIRAARRDRPSGRADGEISRLEKPLDLANFAPCTKNIIEKAEDREGRHRALAVLATYLYQMGWSEDTAFDLWLEVADRCGVESRIFETTFGLLSCPLCSTMLQDTGGYPHLNLHGMGFCVPDEHCRGCQWPGDHHLQKILNENVDKQKAEEQKPKGPTVLEALKAMLEHDSEVRTDKGDSTWEWRVFKPRVERVVEAGQMTAQAEEKAHKFLGKYKKNLDAWGIAYDNLFPLPKKEYKEEFPDKIKAKALHVLKNGDPVRYVVNSCSRTVLGAETAFKKVACCVSVQNVRQSAGLHPKLTGASSGGKTYTIYTFANHLPYEAVIKGSMSAKAGFYHSDGNRVFRILDDYQPGNEDLDTVIKQTTSEFHDTYSHRTVANHAAQTLKIGSEQTWAITSVNNDQDVQVLNRGLPINVDDSEDTTIKVNARTVERYGKGDPTKLVDEQVLVSRCIFQILRDQGYINVRIPFYERINWKDKSNRRNPSIFMDLVIAHTALYRFQRERDSEGYYLATEDDFRAAKALFTDKDSEELVKRLTRREREVLELLVGSPEGVTRSDISEALNIAPQQVSQIILGRNGQGGLMQKVTIKEEKRSEMERINEEQSRTIHRTVYSLKDYDRLSGFDAVVTLEPKPRQETSRNRQNEDESKDESKSNDSSKQDESKESKNKNKIEERESEGGLSSSGEEESILSRAEKKNAFVAFAMEHDSENDAFVFASSTLSSSHEESKVCAKCGEDLTGHGTRTIGDVVYCLKPGCGMPEREEASG